MEKRTREDIMSEKADLNAERVDLQEKRDDLKMQLNKAKRRKAATGNVASREWFNRTEEEFSALGREIQDICARQGELKVEMAGLQSPMFPTAIVLGEILEELKAVRAMLAKHVGHQP
tara:strand:- start:266 stop:619 length:354 start_codon:yes stop_codon:yes gene_type:complete